MEKQSLDGGYYEDVYFTNRSCLRVMTDILHHSFSTTNCYELLTNYSDCGNERLTNNGLESLEKVK